MQTDFFISKDKKMVEQREKKTNTNGQSDGQIERQKN